MSAKYNAKFQCWHGIAMTLKLIRINLFSVSELKQQLSEKSLTRKSPCTEGYLIRIVFVRTILSPNFIGFLKFIEVDSLSLETALRSTKIARQFLSNTT